MPKIHVMIKPASGLCNMRCTYCFYTDEMQHRKQASYGIMTEETLDNVIRRTLEFAEEECTFAFQGGEPTMAGLPFFQRCMELQKLYNVKGITIQNVLQTNGYGLDGEWCSFFAHHHFLLGVSVDGIKATHDACRRDCAGGETYFKVLENIRLLEQYGVEYNILTVVNGKTAPKIRRIYQQYAKLGFAYQQYIICLDPVGEVPGLREYSLTPEVYGQFLIDLFSLWEIDFYQGRQPYIRQFENWIGILLGEMPEACEARGCCSIQNVVEADGSVYPCDFYAMDAYRIGNLKEDSFEEIYRNRLHSGFLEEGAKRTQECRCCRYFPLCRGGCRRQGDAGISGEGAFPSGGNYFCRGFRMFFDSCYDRLEKIARICAGQVGH